MTDSHAVLRIKANLNRVRAVCMGRIVGDTRHAISVREGDRPPVHYFPLDDVETDLLHETDRHSQCPLKGEATAYDVELEDLTVTDAAWIYDKPLPEVLALRSYVAFDPGKVEISESSLGGSSYSANATSMQASA
jgi:uncharacterized protein (DUF427 family)